MTGVSRTSSGDDRPAPDRSAASRSASRLALRRWGAVREHRAALRDRGQIERMNDAAHPGGPGGTEDVLQQCDLVGRELRGVRAADVAVLVVAQERVDAAGILRRELRVRDHHFARRVAIVLAEKVRPIFRLDMRAVNQIAGEDEMRVAFIGRERLLEDVDHAVEVPHAALQIRADEQPTFVGQSEHASHRHTT